ncbi:helix-turn-helix domain-containing protein [Acidobacterium sp. S8]|uniref:helix-turn-helix domain-containing protein n=1 Tax=Acidobacterium sp. S8 TaxID=1641854 RepID=UPI00131AD423|nr:helix-turn-helix domain-containing protein [Acidobacterium sp. S8]
MSNSIFSSPLKPEPFVNAERAALFLDMPRKTLLGLARLGKLPAHGIPGKRRKHAWRFRISELDLWMRTEVTSGSDQGLSSERKFL